MKELPSHASVVVIGGGVMGCSTLYHLARNGVTDAILLERNQLTSGTTWHSAAQVRALRSSRNLTDLIRYSIDLYSQLEQETGQQTGWINEGSLSIATSPERLTHIKRQASLAGLFGVQADNISPQQALERWPLMNADDVLGAVWSPDDGRVSPSDLCAALIKGASSRGCQYRENTPVNRIITDNNKVTAIETADGTILCDAIAVCSGLWSREVAAMAGVEIPVWPCEHFYLLTKPINGISGNMPTLSDHDSHLYIRDDSGGLLIGCFEPNGKPIAPEKIGKDFAFQLLPEDWEHFEPMMHNALHRLPALEHAEVKMLLNGPESFTPDGSFLLGESAEIAGLFLGCGMNSVGVATGGGAGMALAHCIEHGQMPADLSEADPKRFASQHNDTEALQARVSEVLGKHYEITYPGRQWTSARNLRQGPLHTLFKQQQAHFGQFFGWERALYFGSDKVPELSFGKPCWSPQIEQEVRAAQQGAALFDLSSFGNIDVTGKDACRFLQRVCSNDMNRPVNRVIYTTLLNSHGGIESDLTAIRIAADHYRLTCGTTAIKRDLSWLLKHRNKNEQVDIIDSSEGLATIGLMGPDSLRIAKTLQAYSLLELGYFQSCETVLANSKVKLRAARLSYVGEAGWELTCATTDAARLYQQLQEQGAQAAGLFAQTSMRIEKQFPAMGHELDSDITPFEAGLGFAVDLNKDFIGKDALLKNNKHLAKSRVVSILLDDLNAVPLGNEPVLMQGRTIGKTTSAAFGFRVKAPVALADLSEPQASRNNTSVEIDIAGELFSGRVHTRALYDPDGQLMKVR